MGHNATLTEGVGDACYNLSCASIFAFTAW